MLTNNLFTKELQETDYILMSYRHFIHDLP